MIRFGFLESQIESIEGLPKPFSSAFFGEEQMAVRSRSLGNKMGSAGLVPNLSLNRTQRPLSNFTYNDWDFRSFLNIRLAVGPASLHR